MYIFHTTLTDFAFFGAVFILSTFGWLLWSARGGNQSANRLLALALAVVILWTLHLPVMDTGLPAHLSFWSRFPAQFSLAFGPLLFFYVRQIIYPERQFSRRDWFHFIPLLFQTGVFVLESRQRLTAGAVTYQTSIFRALDPFLLLLAFVSVVLYLYRCRRLIEGFYKQLRFTGGDRYRQEWQWLHDQLKVFGLAWLLWIPAAAVGYFYHFRLDGAVYLILLVLMIRLAASAHSKSPGLQPESSSVLRSVLQLELKQKCSWLKRAMQVNRYYVKPELNIGLLADLLDVSIRELSHIINTGLNKNFNDFINEYRVAEVIQKMQHPGNDHLTLQGIAYDSGFNSKSTFNRVFKEMTGKSPAAYKADLKKDFPSRDLGQISGPAAIISRHKTIPEWSCGKFNRNYMFKNYLKIAWRNLAKNRASSVINVGGLAVGMAAALLIGLWIWDELSYNTYHQNYDRIAQVRTRFRDTRTGEPGINSSLQYPLITELQSNYKNSFEYIVPASWDENDILSSGNKNLSRTGLFMGPDAPKMLTLKMVYGSRNGLNDAHSILLSRSTAEAFFGKTDPVNQVLKINNASVVKVTGVYEDLPLNTQFKDLKFVGAFSLWVDNNPWIRQSAMNDWQNHFLKIYAQIAPGVTFGQVTRRIKDAELRNLGNLKEAAKQDPQVFLLPMRDWHLHNYKRNQPDTGPLQMLWTIGTIGTFVLLLACINFMNLSTARSEKRAKEIGVRKAVGSLRRQLIGQFYCESFLIVLISFVLSVALVAVSLPWFNELAGKEIAIAWQSPLFWCSGMTFVLVTSLIAGSYPALYLSSFNAVSVLKGTFKAGRLAALPRKVLVVMQFTVSVALIICTIIIYRQVQMAKDRPVGYTRDGLVLVPKKSAEFDLKTDVLRAALKATGVVDEVSESLGKVTEIASGNGGFQWQGKSPDFNDSFGTLPITFGYGKTVGWQFVSGRDFSRKFPTDSAGMVINESAARYMGLKNPVGEAISWKFHAQPVKHYTIIGIVKDMIMDSPYERPVPTLFMVKGHTGTDVINIRINPGVSAGQALSKIAAAFKKLVPSVPFEYEFADQDYAAKFAAEERIGSIAAVFAALAIFISCLGLFGLASFVAEQRIKEIGVRKVLGASAIQLWGMLSKDFLWLVTLSQLIAFPVAYYFMHNWLQHYQYRTGIPWWIFALTAAGALLITLLTISYQSLKAALTNPVKSLRAD